MTFPFTLDPLAVAAQFGLIGRSSRNKLLFLIQACLPENRVNT